MTTERKLVLNAKVAAFGAIWNIEGLGKDHRTLYLHKVTPAPDPGEAHEIWRCNFFRLVQMIDEGKAAIVKDI